MRWTIPFPYGSVNLILFTVSSFAPFPLCSELANHMGVGLPPDVSAAHAPGCECHRYAGLMGFNRE